MANFRLLDPNPVYWNNDGTVCAGGELRFYTTLTTTPTNAGEGPDLSPSLGATVTLDASGRAEDDIWLPGVTRVRLYDADGALQWDRDYVQDAAVGGITPLDPADANEDDVYSSDGVNAAWRAIREVPDPTGNSGKYVGTDGTAVAWTAFPAATVYDADTLPGSFTQDNAASGSFTIGNIRVQWGADTGPSTGTLKSTKATTFDVAFSGAPYYIGIGVASASSTGEGAGVSAQYTSPSATGFTANFFAGAEDNGGVAEINSTIPYTFVAIGPK